MIFFAKFTDTKRSNTDT